MRLPDKRPIIVAVAGSNGAGKTLFYHSHLKHAGLRFVNADVVARELGLDPYVAATTADALRKALVQERESFVFETVFSDPVGEKVKFLQQAEAVGYAVVLCFIRISDVEMSDDRVAMRVSQGGHDVPIEKLRSRFPRTLANLRKAIEGLTSVMVFDNSDLSKPFQRVAEYNDGKRVKGPRPAPEWINERFK
ncbi:MAG: Zeta toxin [Verrucomicrobiales bacterium]|nr:Zeta toxin [Verrucomicrobiales bacterium]